MNATKCDRKAAPSRRSARELANRAPNEREKPGQSCNLNNCCSRCCCFGWRSRCSSCSCCCCCCSGEPAEVVKISRPFELQPSNKSLLQEDPQRQQQPEPPEERLLLRSVRYEPVRNEPKSHEDDNQIQLHFQFKTIDNEQELQRFRLLARRDTNSCYRHHEFHVQMFKELAPAPASLQDDALHSNDEHARQEDAAASGRLRVRLSSTSRPLAAECECTSQDVNHQRRCQVASEVALYLTPLSPLLSEPVGHASEIRLKFCHFKSASTSDSKNTDSRNNNNNNNNSGDGDENSKSPSEECIKHSGREPKWRQANSQTTRLLVAQSPRHGGQLKGDHDKEAARPAASHTSWRLMSSCTNGARRQSCGRRCCCWSGRHQRRGRAWCCCCKWSCRPDRPGCGACSDAANCAPLPSGQSRTSRTSRCGQGGQTAAGLPAGNASSLAAAICLAHFHSTAGQVVASGRQLETATCQQQWARSSSRSSNSMGSLLSIGSASLAPRSWLTPPPSAAGSTSSFGSFAYSNSNSHLSSNSHSHSSGSVASGATTTTTTTTATTTTTGRGAGSKRRRASRKQSSASSEGNSASCCSQAALTSGNRSSAASSPANTSASNSCSTGSLGGAGGPSRFRRGSRRDERGRRCCSPAPAPAPAAGRGATNSARFNYEEAPVVGSRLEAHGARTQRRTQTLDAELPAAANSANSAPISASGATSRLQRGELAALADGARLKHCDWRLLREGAAPHAHGHEYAKRARQDGDAESARLRDTSTGAMKAAGAGRHDASARLAQARPAEGGGRPSARMGPLVDCQGSPVESAEARNLLPSSNAGASASSSSSSSSSSPPLQPPPPPAANIRAASTQMGLSERGERQTVEAGDEFESRLNFERAKQAEQLPAACSTSLELELPPKAGDERASVAGSGPVSAPPSGSVPASVSASTPGGAPTEGGSSGAAETEGRQQVGDGQAASIRRPVDQKNLLKPIDFVFARALDPGGGGGGGGASSAGLGVPGHDLRAHSFTEASLSHESSSLVAQLAATARSRSLCTENDKNELDKRLQQQRQHWRRLNVAAKRVGELGRRMSRMTRKALDRLRSLSSSNPNLAASCEQQGGSSNWLAPAAGSGALRRGRFNSQRVKGPASRQRGQARPNNYEFELLVPGATNKSAAGGLFGKRNSSAGRSPAGSTLSLRMSQDEQLLFAPGGVYMGPGEQWAFLGDQKEQQQPQPQQQQQHRPSAGHTNSISWLTRPLMRSSVAHALFSGASSPVRSVSSSPAAHSQPNDCRSQQAKSQWQVERPPPSSPSVAPTNRRLRRNCASVSVGGAKSNWDNDATDPSWHDNQASAGAHLVVIRVGQALDDEPAGGALNHSAGRAADDQDQHHDRRRFPLKCDEQEQEQAESERTSQQASGWRRRASSQVGANRSGPQPEAPSSSSVWSDRLASKQCDECAREQQACHHKQSSQFGQTASSARLNRKQSLSAEFDYRRETAAGEQEADLCASQDEATRPGRRKQLSSMSQQQTEGGGGGGCSQTSRSVPCEREQKQNQHFERAAAVQQQQQQQQARLSANQNISKHWLLNLTQRVTSSSSAIVQSHKTSNNNFAATSTPFDERHAPLLGRTHTQAGKIRSSSSPPPAQTSRQQHEDEVRSKSLTSSALAGHGQRRAHLSKSTCEVNLCVAERSSEQSGSYLARLSERFSHSSQELRLVAQTTNQTKGQFSGRPRELLQSSQNRLPQQPASSSLWFRRSNSRHRDQLDYELQQEAAQQRDSSGANQNNSNSSSSSNNNNNNNLEHAQERLCAGNSSREAAAAAAATESSEGRAQTESPELYGANLHSACVHCQLIAELSSHPESSYLCQLLAFGAGQPLPAEKSATTIRVDEPAASGEPRKVGPEARLGMRGPSLVLTACSNQGTSDDDDNNSGLHNELVSRPLVACRRVRSHESAPIVINLSECADISAPASSSGSAGSLEVLASEVALGGGSGGGASDEKKRREARADSNARPQRGERRHRRRRPPVKRRGSRQNRCPSLGDSDEADNSEASVQDEDEPEEAEEQEEDEEEENGDGDGEDDDDDNDHDDDENSSASTASNSSADDSNSAANLVSSAQSSPPESSWPLECGERAPARRVHRLEPSEGRNSPRPPMNSGANSASSSSSSASSSQSLSAAASTSSPDSGSSQDSEPNNKPSGSHNKKTASRRKRAQATRSSGASGVCERVRVTSSNEKCKAISSDGGQKQKEAARKMNTLEVPQGGAFNAAPTNKQTRSNSLDTHFSLKRDARAGHTGAGNNSAQLSLASSSSSKNRSREPLDSDYEDYAAAAGVADTPMTTRAANSSAASIASVAADSGGAAKAAVVGGPAAAGGFLLSVQVNKSARSRSVDISLPTQPGESYGVRQAAESSTHLMLQDKRRQLYDDPTAKGQGKKSARGKKFIQGEIKVPYANGETRALKLFVDWEDNCVIGEHLWVYLGSSSEACYVGESECLKHGPRLSCSACKITAHTGCIGILTDKIKFICKHTFKDLTVNNPRHLKEIHHNVIYHHWVHKRTHCGRCKQCTKTIGNTKLPFSSKEIQAITCSWCKVSYHNKENCYTLSTLTEPCTLGAHRESIIPPSWIVKLPVQSAPNTNDDDKNRMSDIYDLNQKHQQATNLIDLASCNALNDPDCEFNNNDQKENFELFKHRQEQQQQNPNSNRAVSQHRYGSSATLTTDTSGYISADGFNSNMPTSNLDNNMGNNCEVLMDPSALHAVDLSIINQAQGQRLNEQVLMDHQQQHITSEQMFKQDLDRDSSPYSVFDTQQFQSFRLQQQQQQQQPKHNQIQMMQKKPEEHAQIFRNFKIDPHPIPGIPNAGSKPVLVFVNPRSGGNQGTKMMQKFNWLLNPRQVFDLIQSSGPRAALELYRDVPNLRILTIGGDGTASWILSHLDDVGVSNKIPVAVLPLGTGNDLARALGWGGGYADEPIAKILAQVRDGEVVQLDRWNLHVERNHETTPSSPNEFSSTGSGANMELGSSPSITSSPSSFYGATAMTTTTASTISVLDQATNCDMAANSTIAVPASVLDETGSDRLPMDVINNYFSFGVDAHIALEFHNAREAHPERFNSRLRNKMFYGQAGGKDLLKRKWKDLSNFVTLYCDGQDITSRLKELKVHSVLFLNIPSYGGGTRPWPTTATAFAKPRTDDGLIEVIGLTTYQLPLLQAGGHGTCIAQCRNAKIITSRTIPMQVDGEPCKLLPSIITISFKNRVCMLSKSKGSSHPQKVDQ